jgi:hypothetical protein
MVPYYQLLNVTYTMVKAIGLQFLFTCLDITVKLQFFQSSTRLPVYSEQTRSIFKGCDMLAFTSLQTMSCNPLFLDTQNS